jgi:hypothetical protein
MRTLKRNQRKFWYCLYQDAEEIYDEYGNATGDYVPSYSEAQEMYANISPASGYAQTEQFGNLDSYDKVIVTDWMDCPIDENSVLFIDKEPEHDMSTDTPLFDYTVRRVAKSLNSISIAVQKVNVG